MIKKKIEGIVAAAFTPMNEKGEINFEKIPILTEHLIRQRLQGIYVCGSTGEGPSMTGTERKQVAEAFVQAAGKRIPILVHVGHNSIKEAKELAAHAQKAGADYISSVAPSYYKMNSVASLAANLAEIAAGAPDLPFYYYHIPRLTDISTDMPSLLEYAEHSIPSFAGIKFTAPEIHEYQACLNYSNKKYDILYGTDEMLLSALSVGAKGCIGSTYNFLAPLYHQLWECFDKGDSQNARELQLKSVKIVRIIVKYGGLAVQKEMMKLAGIDCGGVRHPLQQLSAKAEQSIKADLQEADFFDFIS